LKKWSTAKITQYWRQWMPLVMQHRDPGQMVAATQVKHGTDVDFGVRHASWSRL